MQLISVERCKVNRVFAQTDPGSVWGFHHLVAAGIPFHVNMVLGRMPPEERIL